LNDLARRSNGRTATQQKIGDFFAACMDEAAIEKAGIAPLKPGLDAIARIKSKNELPALFALLQSHTTGFGFQMLFGFHASQDFADATQVIAFAEAGGLGLPERDYYFRDDAKSVELRNQYVAHVARLLQLAGDPPEAARNEAAAIMRIETALAGASLRPVER